MQAHKANELPTQILQWQPILIVLNILGRVLLNAGRGCRSWLTAEGSLIRKEGLSNSTSLSLIQKFNVQEKQSRC